MSKSFAFLTILISAGLAVNSVSAATVLQCNSRRQTCFQSCLGKYSKTGDINNCRTRCDNLYVGCMQPTKSGKFQVPRGPNVVITTPKSTRGSTPIQTGGTAVIATTPTRPLGPNGRPGANPCTVHCGPQGGRKR
jgi:hypothetical protein